MKQEAEIKKNKIPWRAPLEVTIQGIILCQCMDAVVEMAKWGVHGSAAPNDFMLYYNAAVGSYKDVSGDIWSYKDWVGVIFTPMHWETWFQAYAYWGGNNS